MYQYLMKVRAYKKDVELKDEFITAIKDCIEKTNNKDNAQNRGYVFKYEGQIDSYSIKISLLSNVSVVPTRALASITTTLVKDYPEITDTLKYCNNVLKGEELKSSKEDFSNISPDTIVKTVFDIYYGQETNKKNKKLAREYSEKIKDIVVSYLEQTSHK